MRKYNMSSDNSCNQNGTPPVNQNPFPFSRHSFRGVPSLPPFFDVPCLYYPQYPCDWSYGQCENAYAIYSITSANSNTALLNLCQNVQDGRSIHLDSDNETIILQPGKLYLALYHIQTQSIPSLHLVPIVDGISDLCNASSISNPIGVDSALYVSNSFLLPVVESPSTLQLQLQDVESSAVEAIRGTVSIVELANL